MKKYIVLLFVFGILGLEACNSQGIRIIPAPMQPYMDTIRYYKDKSQILGIRRFDYFLVEDNNVYNGREVENEIIDFVEKIPDSIKSKNNYNAFFFLSSSDLNVNRVKQLPPGKRDKLFRSNVKNCLMYFEWDRGSLVAPIVVNSKKIPKPLKKLIIKEQTFGGATLYKLGDTIFMYHNGIPETALP